VACSSPAGNEGDTIYNDSGVGSGKMQYRDGTKWVEIGGTGIAINGLAGYRSWTMARSSCC
jgi:hypothetical protein